MKVVILGSLKYGPYEIFFVPQRDPNGLESAQKKCFDAIDRAEEVWVNLPMGEHTLQDVKYATKQGKHIRYIKNQKDGPFDALKWESKYLTPEAERILDADWEKTLTYIRANPPDCSECTEKMEFFEQEEKGVMVPMFRCNCGYVEDPGAV